tara:strand:- start:77 stop:385 length:309 start_codon:yes stop_codon:yes gene_type:complete
MPKNVPVPVPLDRWFRDVKKIEELRKILDSETFQEASATLKESAGPSYGSVTTDAGTNSTRHAWYAGYRDAFNDLYKLTKLQDTTNAKPNLEEWMHIQTPQQ